MELDAMPQLSARALAASSNGVLIADARQPSCPIIYANPAFCRITGYAQDELLGRDCLFLQEADSEHAAALPALRRAMASGKDARVVLCSQRKDGTPFWNDLFLSPVPDQHGELAHYIGIVTDITELKEGEQRLAFHSTHDKLTGLPNRHLFTDRLQQALLQAQRHGGQLALLCIGIDNYAFVNESLGHAGGDQLMAGAAERVRASVRSEDTVALLGGNEFVVILGDVASPSDAITVCETIFAALAPAFTLQGQQVHASASIGIVLSPQDGRDGATLLRYADMALTRARELGGAHYQFFASEMNHRTLERIGMEAALRLAVFRDELQLRYQPLADLRSGW